MRKPALKVSRAWIDEVFASPPRRDIVRVAKSTSRFQVRVPKQNCTFYAEGGNEHIALLIARYLQSLGHVKRFKAQPFALEEIGGPIKRVPDLLVEFEDRIPYLPPCVVQSKSKRFMTPEVTANFEQERECLTELGFGFQVWTNRDKVGQPISSNLRDLDRGFICPPPPEVVAQIREKALPGSTLGDLLIDFSRDDVIGAAALCAIHFDIRSKLDEKSIVTLHPPKDYINYFFESGNVPVGWWESLPSRKAD